MSKKLLIIVAHPNKQSFNHALLERATQTLREAGHVVRVQDLYSENFDGVLKASELAALQQGVVAEDVLREQANLTWADGLIIMYPLWWMDRPAILKGWFDRVFTHGFAFRYGPGGVEGMLELEKALVVVTVGSGPEDIAALGMGEERLLSAVTTGSLGFAGVSSVEEKVFFSVPSVGDDERAGMLNELQVDLLTHWPSA